MKVQVRLFAALRETLGQDQLELELPPGTTIDGLWDRLLERDPRLAPFAGSVSFAVNHDFVARDKELLPDDEVAFLPPVSGG